MTDGRKKYRIAIRKNQTGEVRHFDFWFASDDSLNWWKEDDHACDCNRAWQFQRAGGEELSAKEPCGNVRYSILYAETETGKKIRMDKYAVDRGSS